MGTGAFGDKLRVSVAVVPGRIELLTVFLDDGEKGGATLAQSLGRDLTVGVGLGELPGGVGMEALGELRQQAGYGVDHPLGRSLGAAVESG